MKTRRGSKSKVTDTKKKQTDSKRDSEESHTGIIHSDSEPENHHTRREFRKSAKKNCEVKSDDEESDFGQENTKRNTPSRNRSNLSEEKSNKKEVNSPKKKNEKTSKKSNKENRKDEEEEEGETRSLTDDEECKTDEENSNKMEKSQRQAPKRKVQSIDKTVNSSDKDEKNDSDKADSDFDKSKKPFNSKKRKEQNNKTKEAENESDVSDGTSSTEYEVEKIVDVYFKKDGRREFLVRWKGYSSKDDTWEPEKHLNCQELIENFIKKCEKARALPAREMRTSRRTTERYVVNEVIRGRKLSSRLKHGPRKTYFEDL